MKKEWIKNHSGIFRVASLLAVLTILSACSKPEQGIGNSASDRTLATAATLESERKPVLKEAQELAAEKKGSEALDALEVWLKSHPDDIVAGNLYRRLATETNLYDRPIKFFVAIVKSLTACPKETPGCPDTDKDCVEKTMDHCSSDAEPPGPPSGVRYNLAFAYIDKIPVVGPMGAGFLSKRSIAQFKQALEEDPDDWIANYGVGMNYLHWPDYFEKNDTSISYFERAIELQEAREIRPSDILAYVRLGDALAKAGNAEQARAAWERGVARLGRHGDLAERLEIAPANLKEAVTEAYNPNNSIGAINTDISILWTTEMPPQVFSLKNPEGPVVIGGVGGQTLPEREDTAGSRMFNWFRDNLPLLLNRDNADKVDMSGIGATGGEGAGIIAYNMIKGFMTQFRGDSDATVMEALANAPDYERPFFHEGIGMGLAAALDTSAEGSLAPFADRIAPFDRQHYERLHYAGLGMWYGLAPTVNLVRVRSKLGELDLRGQFYAYEGLGFAVTLFGNSVKTGAAELVQRLPFTSGSTFAHGAGRALWIKHGDEAAEISSAIATFPDQFRSDARAGFGMGVAFTRIDRPDAIIERSEPFRKEAPAACLDYLGGAAMGLAIREQNDADYTREALKAGSPQSLELTSALLDAALAALAEVEQTGVEMHRNWRIAIHNQVTSGPAAPLAKTTCEETNP